MGRWLLFIIAILAGIGAGLYYGWEVNPIEYSNTSFDTLKGDYQADYVLMIAEIFRQEADLSNASSRLSRLTDTPPDAQVRQALLFAERAGYANQDLDALKILLTAYENQPSAGGAIP